MTARPDPATAPPAAVPAATSTRRTVIGLLGTGLVLGVAWSSSLRAFMAQLAGPDSTFTWLGTFLAVILPGGVVGALLGWAEHLRRNGGRCGWRSLAFSPPLFPIAALSQPGGITKLVTSGQGGGAIGIAVGHARRRRPVRPRAAVAAHPGRRHGIRPRAGRLSRPAGAARTGPGHTARRLGGHPFLGTVHHARDRVRDPAAPSQTAPGTSRRTMITAPLAAPLTCLLRASHNGNGITCAGVVSFSASCPAGCSVWPSAPGPVPLACTAGPSSSPLSAEPGRPQWGGGGASCLVLLRPGCRLVRVQARCRRGRAGPRGIFARPAGSEDLSGVAVSAGIARADPAYRLEPARDESARCVICPAQKKTICVAWPDRFGNWSPAQGRRSARCRHHLCSVGVVALPDWP